MSRPKKLINKEEFEKLCQMQCTKPEIQAWLDVSDKRLDKWVKEVYGDESSFSGIYAIKRGPGKVSLRRMQFQIAMKGNATMLIWLGKQWLEQKDKQETTHEAGKSITLNYKLD